MYQEVVRPPQSRRTGRTTDGYFAESELLPRKAGSEMQVGAGFLEAYVLVLCLQNAALSHPEKSLALASSQRGLAFSDVATTARRLFGCLGGAAGQDFLAAENAGESLGSNEDQEACASI